MKLIPSSYEHFVYLIYSEAKNIFYKGYSSDPVSRCKVHNEGESKYTSGKGPWKLVFVAGFEDKKSALEFEKKLKRGNKDHFQKLIQSPINLLR